MGLAPFDKDCLGALSCLGSISAKQSCLSDGSA